METLDRIDTQTFMWPDIVTDFTYSVSLASDGETR